VQKNQPRPAGKHFLKVLKVAVRTQLWRETINTINCSQNQRKEQVVSQSDYCT